MGKNSYHVQSSFNRVAGDHTIKAYYLPRGKVNVFISLIGPEWVDFVSGVTGQEFSDLCRPHSMDIETFQGDIINAVVDGKVKCSRTVNKVNDSFEVWP